MIRPLTIFCNNIITDPIAWFDPERREGFSPDVVLVMRTLRGISVGLDITEVKAVRDLCNAVIRRDQNPPRR